MLVPADDSALSPSSGEEDERLAGPEAEPSLRYFRKVVEGLDVAPLLREVEAAKDLWDAHTERTAGDGPMAGTSDLWVRYFPRETLKGPADYLGEGRPEFYPAWDRLPSLHPIVFGLMSLCRGVELGCILLSRIPPFGRVGTHVDGAAWTARHYSRKFYLPIQAGPGCVNRTLDEEMVIRPGQVVEFVNTVPHSVENSDPLERINVIVSLRGVDA